MNTDTNRQIFEKLNQMIHKEAAHATGASQSATSIPGGDVKVEQVDPKHENHDKNAVGADKLAPQSYEQHKATDASAPLKAASHLAVEKLGQELLLALNKVAKSVTGPDQSATSIPGGDVAVEQVDPKHENHDKNAVGAAKLAPQSYGQHKATDASAPLKTAEDVNRAASRELGRVLAQTMFKQAAEQAQIRELNLYKEAGRRDFETMIAAAAQELGAAQELSPKQSALSPMQEKQAEELGARLFETLFAEANAGVQKTAAAAPAPAPEPPINMAILRKLAQLEASNAALQQDAADARAVVFQKEADEKEARKMAAWAEYGANLATEQMMARLRTELSSTSGR